MSRVKVLVDSASDIPQNLSDELGITVVPINVHFGETTYLDRVELGPLEFYDLLETSPYHPSTTPPAPETFAKAYEALIADGSAVVSIHLSGELGGTLAAAREGRAMVGRGEIVVIDSRQVSMAYGLPAVAGARAAAAGRSLAEVVSEVKSWLERSSSYFTVDTLDYLARNGRIGRAQALLGTLLATKPVLTMQDGLVTPFEKVRGTKNVVPRLVEIVEEAASSGPLAMASVVHANALEKATELRGLLEERCGISDCLICDLGTVIGTHAGPGAVGVVFCRGA